MGLVHVSPCDSFSCCQGEGTYVYIRDPACRMGIPSQTNTSCQSASQTRLTLRLDDMDTKNGIFSTTIGQKRPRNSSTSPTARKMESSLWGPDNAREIFQDMKTRKEQLNRRLDQLIGMMEEEGYQFVGVKSNIRRRRRRWIVMAPDSTLLVFFFFFFFEYFKLSGAGNPQP